MTRWLAALLGCLFLAGCPQNLPPEPPFPPDPPGPIVVAQDPARDDAADGAEAQTRQRALRVMAAEQHSIIVTLWQQTRFVRISTRMVERVSNALTTCEEELTSIDGSIATLAGDDSASAEERRARQDELKSRLHRLASKLALMQTALQGE
jgi:hypothetical protein